MKKTIRGFSKLTKSKKIEWLGSNFFKNPSSILSTLNRFQQDDEKEQAMLDGFSENAISNFVLPFSVAPNFVINDQAYCIPMVIEESSVVAAASNAAKFWMTRGGFKATILGKEKIGQIHLSCVQDEQKLQLFFDEVKNEVLDRCASLTKNMEGRGGGVQRLELISFPEEENYYQIRMSFDTCDSMGANFINTLLEQYAKEFIDIHQKRYGADSRIQIIMCILSNYTPDCIVRAEVSCEVDQLGQIDNMTPLQFAYKFKKAIRIAEIDPYRATTHNKGIYNGIDAVVLATGNDFRAIEACGHTYASRDGRYRSLSHCTIDDNIFRFWLDVPLAVGTVGGLTKLHPMSKVALELLNQPNSDELMKIIACVGLAQNFGAVKSLITTGIQRGHMKMHLFNVLHQLKATEQEFKLAVEHFKDKIVSHSAVREFILTLRPKK